MRRALRGQLATVAADLGRCASCDTAVTSRTVRRAQTFLARMGATLTERNAAYGDSVPRPLRVFSRAADRLPLIDVDMEAPYTQP